MRSLGFLVCSSSLVHLARGSRSVTLDNTAVGLTFRGLWADFAGPGYIGASVSFASGAGASVTTGPLTGGT